jgi:hypothetical protein
MGTTPSSQDESQAYEFGRKFDLPWLLRGIVNKAGIMSLDLFWFEYGFIIRDLSWDIVYTLDDSRTARLKEDVSKRVRPFSSSYTYQPPQGAYQYPGGYSRHGDY